MLESKELYSILKCLYFYDESGIEWSMDLFPKPKKTLNGWATLCNGENNKTTKCIIKLLVQEKVLIEDGLTKDKLYRQYYVDKDKIEEICEKTNIGQILKG